MAAFGVHLGSTSACLAVFKDGKTDVVANDLGDRVTPCVVAFTDHDKAVGAAAKQGVIRNAQNTVKHVKQVLGRKWEDQAVKQYIESNAVKMQQNSDGDPVFNVEFQGETTLVAPQQIAEAVYEKMLETARSHGDGDIHDSVFAVPTDFNSEQRSAISDSATAAGFNVLRLISEPVSAVLAYDIGQENNNINSNVLVFRLGGESSEVSIVKVQNGLYRVLGSEVSTELAGSKFTDVLANYLASEFYRQYKLDVKESRRSFTKLRMATETCKHTLSTLGSAHCSVDSLHEGVDFHSNVSRARFENLCSNLIQQCESLIDSACTKSNIDKEQIDKVILCGGGAKIPLVQKKITDYLKNAEILNSITPDEVVAIGAAKQAAILTGNDENDIQQNATFNGESNMSLFPIFESFTPLPSRKHETVTLNKNQTSMEMNLCECEDIRDPKTVSDLAKIVMKDLPNEAKVSVTFHLRREGSLHVTCREETSDKTESVIIEVCR
ncbi:hypothetical protein KUTeg_021017 [Tegillarca granosa]|uniref:Heat shock 70 kDa protein 14 n=1 Tax=Tegillarca granosa TaxID=220873 RepID=A0ABQ9EA40_TEGGR|nr:hypothetical protein KUTeg_021017 [Tegillarca granosa]